MESEHNIQAAFVDWVLWTYKNDPSFIRPLFFSTLNGAFLGGGDEETRGRGWGKLRKAGAVPGVSDTLYLQARGEWSYLALELKTEKRKRSRDRGLSEDQIIFLDAVSEAGGLPVVSYGIDEAIESFRKYMSHAPRLTPFLNSVLQSARALKSEESRP